MTLPKSNRKSGYVLPAGLIWVSLVFAGFSILEHEEFTPAAHVAIAANFPAASTLKLDPARPTLLLFAHSQCPCTEATFRELGKLRSMTGDNLAITIIFPMPAHTAPGWEKGELWSEALQMPGVHVCRDDGGAETRLFAVTTSGHTLLYSPAGQLLFSGGITLSRGHDGDNPGAEAIERLVRGETLALRETPVFGCTLL